MRRTVPVFRLCKRCQNPIEQVALRKAHDRISEESSLVDAYISKLNAFGDFGVEKKPWQAPPRHAVSVEQHYIAGAPHRAAPPPRDDPQRWPDPPSRPVPSAPPPAHVRARKQPNKDWRAAAPKVDSGKAGPSARKKQAAKEKEPWEAWEGQDRELAGNLANDIMEYSPGIRWDDIAGLHNAKQILKEAMVLPLLKPELFTGIRKPVKGVLLFGPPGTGKTLLAKALATECETTFFSVSSSTLASKWRGESERMVRVMFAMARAKAPATIFVDEIDSLCSSRGDGDNDASRRVKTEILVQINGIQAEGQQGGRVMVMGATNFPWELDEALRRRLEKRIYIPLPGLEERKELLRINIKGVEIAEDCDFDKIAAMGEGYSGDDITNVCRDAAMNGIRRAIEGKDLEQIRQLDDGEMHEPIRMMDFQEAFRKIRPSVGQEHLKLHEQWRAEFGSA